MIQFFQTRMGQRLIEHTLPELVRQLERLNNNLEASNNWSGDANEHPADRSKEPLPRGSWQITREGWIVTLRIEWKDEPRAVVQVASYRLFAVGAEAMAGVGGDLRDAAVSMGRHGYSTHLAVEVGHDEEALAVTRALEQLAARSIRS